MKSPIQRVNTEKWNPDLSKKLQSKSYRRMFFLILIEMSPSNASRSANPENDVKWSTVEHILSKIGVNLSAKAE